MGKEDESKLQYAICSLQWNIHVHGKYVKISLADDQVLFILLDFICIFQAFIMGTY